MSVRSSREPAGVRATWPRVHRPLTDPDARRRKRGV